MATTSTNFISALGGGSGIDVKALAQGLVDAEKIPQKDIVDKKIAKSEARISGLATINFIVKELKTKFSSLDDLSDFSNLNITNTNSSAFTVSSGATASPGVHEIEVLALAKSQRSLSAGFATSTTPINNASAFDLSLSIGGGASQNIAISAETPRPKASCCPSTKPTRVSKPSSSTQAQAIRLIKFWSLVPRAQPIVSL